MGSPKFGGGITASQVSHLELLITTPNPGNFSYSMDTVMYIWQNSIGKLTMSHPCGEESEAFIYRIEKKPQEYA